MSRAHVWVIHDRKGDALIVRGTRRELDEYRWPGDRIVKYVPAPKPTKPKRRKGKAKR